MANSRTANLRWGIWWACAALVAGWALARNATLASAAPAKAGPAAGLPEAWEGRAQAPLWTAPRFRDLAFVGNKTLALDDLRCQLFEIDLRSGKALSAMRVTTPPKGPSHECSDRLIGNALLLRRPNRDTVVEPLSRATLVELSPTMPEVEFVWHGTDEFLVAAERYTARMRALPANQVHAFARATGRSLWTVSLPKDHDLMIPLVSDRDHLYVKASPIHPGKPQLLAFRLADGTLAWQSDLGHLPPRVGAAGLVDARAKEVRLIERGTGTVRWTQALPATALDAAVGESTVHAVIKTRGGAELITLAAQDGRVLWSKPLAWAPNQSPNEPLALFASRGRIFHLGYKDDHAGLLSGFDATTGLPTLDYWVAGESHVGLLDQDAGLLWAQTAEGKTIAFAPTATLQPREVVVSGTVAHDRRSIARRESLAGIPVCSADGCVETNAAGKYTLRVKGSGRLPIWIDTLRWARSLRGLPPQPPFDELFAPEVSRYVDGEARSPVIWNPKVRVGFTGRE